MVVIPLQPAPVSARALSTTSRRTVSTSKLSPDAQTRLAEFREALPQRLDVPSRVVGFRQLHPPLPEFDGSQHARPCGRPDAATGFRNPASLGR